MASRPGTPEAEDEGDYIGTDEIQFPVAFYEKLINAINRYDVALMADVGRSNSDKDASLNSIAVGLVEINNLVKSNKNYQFCLGYVFARFLNAKLKRFDGLSFNQILEQANTGHDCHNAYAEAMRACFTGFKILKF